MRDDDERRLEYPPGLLQKAGASRGTNSRPTNRANESGRGWDLRCRPTHECGNTDGGVNTGHGHGSQKNSKNPTKSPTKGYATF